MKASRGIWIATVLSVTTITLYAQPKDNAPYSRLGLGEQVNHSLSSAGFGGLTAAYYDPLHINLLNPASYGWLNAATFEAGMFAEKSTLSFKGAEGQQETPVWTGNLSHLALAFPMRNPLNDVLENKKRDFFWAMNIALAPNTIVGYDIQTEEVTPNLDSTLNVFQGTGGTSKLVWGNGFRYKDLSGGININYIFGQLESERQVFFRNLGASFYNDFIDNVSIQALQITLGFQYRLRLDRSKDNGKPGKHTLVLGFYGNPSSSFSTRTSALRLAIHNSIFVTDTLLNQEDLGQKGKLPMEWTLGATYEFAGKLRAGAEFSRASWSKYENEAKPEQLFDSNRLAVGVEYIPNVSSYNSFLKRIRYRAGFYHRSDPRLDDLTQYALTLGLGLPVLLPRGQTSFVNIAVEIGRFDTSSAIQENFVKMSLGFTLNDGTWFYKRKFR